MKRISILPLICHLLIQMVMSAPSGGENTSCCSLTHCFCPNSTDINLAEFLKKHCTEEKVSIIIGDTNFTTLKSNIFQSTNCRQLSTIRLLYGRIGKLESDAFKGLGQLKVLDLNSNQINSLEVPGLFLPIGNSLKELFLNFNNISELTVKSFDGLTALTRLEIQGNPLVKIHINTFKSVINLQNLSLSSSAKTLILPDGLFRTMNQLAALNLNNLNLKKINKKTFEGLNNLQILHLSNNLISNISEDVFEGLPTLVELNLRSNLIMCLKSSVFIQLINLRSLDLSYNRLSYIQNGAFLGLDNLTLLNLSKNPIAVIEKLAFCSLKNLNRLEIKIIGKILFNVYDKYGETAFSYFNKSTQIVGIDNIKPYTGLGKQCVYPPINTTSSSGLNAICPYASMKDLNFDSTISENPESRRYLLIIVALCIAFLLIAFSVIMTYRAWSKRKMQAFNDEENADEKQDMLERQGAATNQTTELAVLQNGVDPTAHSKTPDDKQDKTAPANNQHRQQSNGALRSNNGSVTERPASRLPEERQPSNPGVEDNTIIQLGMV